MLKKRTWIWAFRSRRTSIFPKSTHETFAQKLYQTFPKNKRFIKPKLSRTSFTISIMQERYFKVKIRMQNILSYQT
ncbi:hypothetical protein L1987_53804 [Smallanthus sonchifolius]|uniref:Uncharacterized protein n=1 Tax=Smallanthus sonchifolius TaxID=185202 RepID=A0ACB9EX03_9ASTR|nr:hypothetical protein L1987_53804 [Smallanthus sonchifolius]